MTRSPLNQFQKREGVVGLQSGCLAHDLDTVNWGFDYFFSVMACYASVWDFGLSPGWSPCCLLEIILFLSHNLASEE